MDGEDGRSDELLRRALIEPGQSVSVALRVGGLSVSEHLTIVFHGREDLGTLQTYVANGKHGTGSAVAAEDLLRVPCDLDLAIAEDREAAEQLYLEQAKAMQEALVGADTVMSIWREPLQDIASSPVNIDHRIDIDARIPLPRLMPCALVANEKHIVVTPVCKARPLSEGRPPLGIACIQQDASRIYPLHDDPERCLEDFMEYSAEQAKMFAEQLSYQEASVRRFMEISGGSTGQTS